MSETLDRLRSSLARRYVIEHELGRGGMATVYVAFDKRHDRHVAIKVFPPALAAAIGPERFQREIAITSRLSHPHILPLYDSGQAAGALYYVMPLVKGESLRARLDRSPDGLPLKDMLSIADQIAGALDHAHELGVIHRDVTPDNILLSNGHAQLADFGIARLVEGETLTESGMPLGTAMYRSPEQAAGHSKVGAASDIYSLGCVLYESGVGERARKFLSNRFTTPVPPLRKLRRDASAGMEAALARAMSIDPGQRFKTAMDLAGAMTRRPPLIERIKPFRRAAAVFIVAVAAVAAGTLGFRARSAPPTNRSLVLVGRFVNRTGDKSLDVIGEMAGDYIARGIAETNFIDVIDSRAENLVPPVNNPLAVRAAAESLGAGTTVQGSYYRTGDQLHFETQIVDTRSGKMVAATKPADGTLNNVTVAIESLRQHVMGSFAALFGPRFDSWEAETLPPSFEAYKEILAGEDAAWKFEYHKSFEHYRRAAQLDTTYDAAKTFMSLSAALEGECGVVDSIASALRSARERLSEVDKGRLGWSVATCRGDNTSAIAAGMRVLDYAPRSVTFAILVGVAALEDFRPQTTINVLTRLASVRNLTPRQSSMRTSFMGLARHEMEDHRAELATVREGRRTLPDDPDLKTDELVALAVLGRIDEMRMRRDEWWNGDSNYDRELWNPAQVNLCLGTELRAHGRRGDGEALITEAAAWFAAHRASKNVLPVDVLCAFRLLVPAYYGGKLSDAKSFYQRVLARDSLDFQAHEGLGAIAARERDAGVADRMDAWLASHRYFELGRGTYSRARIAVLLGRTQRGMQLLEDAMREGLQFRMLIHVDPDLEPLHNFPAYRRLLAVKR